MNFLNLFWSWLGSFLGIYLITFTNKIIDLNNLDLFFLVGSFGASAVLLYAAPHVEFAQPKNLLGGQFFSALIGVTIFKYVQLDIEIVSALAVSSAIVFMQITKTLHPPGGATALIAVIGSPKIHQLGYLYAVFPILSGSLLMLFVALIINNLSHCENRKYPRS